MAYKVTGSIVTYNNKDIIGKTITSLFKYTGGMDFKLYVVDNVSKDGTAAYVKENFPQVTVIEMKKNAGFGAGHNAAIKVVDSDYHFVINPDIFLCENAIKKMCDFLEENSDVGLASPHVLSEDGSEQLLGKKDPHLKYLFASRFRGKKAGRLLKEYTLTDREITEPVDIENATGCFMALRTSLLKKIGGFDERYFMYFEDADITRTVRQYARAVYCPFATVYHVWERGSATNKKLLLIHVQSMLKYYLKWKTI